MTGKAPDAVGIVAIICLVIGIIGVVLTVIVPQNLNILLLALLAIGLFLENHKALMDTFYGPIFGMVLKGIRILILVALVVGFAFYIITNLGIWTPIFMALLSIGLFFANRSFNQLQASA